MSAHAQRMSSLLAADKEFPPCRVARRAYGAGRGAVGDRGARSVQGRARLQIRSRGQGGERTVNMWSMCVTLEVSKVNGWSNADACCRKSNGGNMMRGELRAGRRQVAARATASKQRAGEGSSAGSLGHGRGAHEEHAVHDCDAGGVKAQRLVERRRALPRVERRADGAGRAAGRDAGGGRRPRRTRRAGGAQFTDWEQGRGGRSARRTCGPCL